jgi:hypothetical protein
MLGHDIVVLGLSAWGVDPRSSWLRACRRDFPASLSLIHPFPARRLETAA